MRSFHFPEGETMEPVEMTFDYDFGNDVDYPFDQYSGYFEIMASVTGNVTATIPISFKLEASVTTYSFTPTLRQFDYATDKIGLKIVAGRSTTTLGFSIFICILMWALSLVIALISYQVVLRGRRVDAHSTMLGITMLFALPALRQVPLFSSSNISFFITHAVHSTLVDLLSQEFPLSDVLPIFWVSIGMLIFTSTFSIDQKME